MLMLNFGVLRCLEKHINSHVPVNTHWGQHIHSSTHTEYCHDINGKRVLGVEIIPWAWTIIKGAELCTERKTATTNNNLATLWKLTYGIKIFLKIEDSTWNIKHSFSQMSRAQWLFKSRFKGQMTIKPGTGAVLRFSLWYVLVLSFCPCTFKTSQVPSSWCCHQLV